MIPREQRFNASRPCPACGSGKGNGWCYVLDDGKSFWCGRSETFNGRRGRPHPDRRRGGWFHDFLDAAAETPIRPAPVHRPAAEPRPDFEPLARRFRRALTPGRIQHLAGKLGLLPRTLTRLSVGWATASDLEQLNTRYVPLAGYAPADQGVWTFPMEDGSGNVVGIRTRTLTGQKFAIRGTDGSGLFVPHAPTIVRDSQLLLPEGPTSAAALLQLGFAAVGRPNNNAGVAHLLSLVRRLRPSRVVVFGDNDRKPDGRWPGLDGALEVARAIGATWAGNVNVAMPGEGAKDPRDWFRRGASLTDVVAAVRNPARDLAVCGGSRA